ncbi:hypothetical protein, partial [Pseudomonas parakoreensis]|uniref:hypothetical protein n=1 Tax=Pseudomonas parakoreensis TaxID=2892331 RepID=UPI001F3DF04F
RQHQELGAGTNRVPEPGAGSGTAANIKGSVTRSRDNYLENRRAPTNDTKKLVSAMSLFFVEKETP